MLENTSYDARKDTIKYVSDYMYANHNEFISEKQLDLFLSGLGDTEFSLKNFMALCCDKQIDYELKINYIKNYEPNDYYLKSVIDDNVILYHIRADDFKYVYGFANYVVNEKLVFYLSEHDRLNEYEELKTNEKSFENGVVDIENMHFELYKFTEKSFDISEYFDVKI